MDILGEEEDRLTVSSVLIAFFRSFAFTSARILVMGWFVYFGVEFGKGIERGAAFFLAMFPLSIYGLWMLTGLPKRMLKADQKASRVDDPGHQRED